MIFHWIELLRRNKSFFVPFAILVLLGGYGVYRMDHGDLVLFFHDHHLAFLDYFFFVITYAGSGYAFGALVVVLLFVRYYYAIIALVNLLLNTLVVQGLKRFVFEDHMRPVRFFPKEHLDQCMDWVNLHAIGSFPSGHTATGFSVCLLILLITKRVGLGFAFFVLAVLIGLSRIWLHQHFTRDVYAGAVIGVLVTLIVYSFFRTKVNPSKHPWLNRSLLKSGTPKA